MSIKNSILSKSNQYKYYKGQYEKLKKENGQLKARLDKSENESPYERMDYEKGISFIIPSYKGENHIAPLLDSLEKQTLSTDFYDLIFVLNGEMDSTIDLINEFIDNNPDIDVLAAYTPVSGASHARNVGLRLVKREYTGFIDDDDFVSPKYIEKLLEHSRPNRVVMTNFIDINEETGEEMESPLVPFSVEDSGIIEEAPVKFFDLAVITQAKSIPSYAAKSVKFNENLTSGVDVSYYGFLYPRFEFEYYFIDKKEEAVYYRIQRPGSISRQKMSFQFNVLDRLKVIDDLNESYKNTNNEKFRQYLRKSIWGQSGFMKRYIEKNRSDKEKVIDEVKKHDLEYFPYKRLEEI